MLKNTITAGEYFSKDEFMNSLICFKRAWLSKHMKGIASNSNELKSYDIQAFRVASRAILAPGGTEIKSTGNLILSAAKTKALLSKNTATIYNAVFLAKTGEYVIVDLVTKDIFGINLFECIAEGRPDERNVYEMGYTLYCTQLAGVTVNTVNAILLNKNYVAKDILTKEYLILRDLTLVVRRVTATFTQKVKSYRKNLLELDEPEEDIGVKCKEPLECPFKDHCWGSLPTNNIFDVRSIELNKQMGYYYKGIVDMADVRERIGKKLTPKSTIQITSGLSDTIAIQKDAIKIFLEPLKTKELFFWDVETIASVVPLISGSRSGAEIVAQYSIHKQSIDGKISHIEYLADPQKNPNFRRECLIKLLTDLEASTSTSPILVFYQSYEVKRLNEYAADFPEFSSEIKKVVERIYDLCVPFKNLWYYDPRFKGSYSLKVILPILCPDLSYNALKITNGKEARLNLLKLYTAKGKIKREIELACKEYCKLDTWAMKRILDFLFQL